MDGISDRKWLLSNHDEIRGFRFVDMSSTTKLHVAAAADGNTWPLRELFLDHSLDGVLVHKTNSPFGFGQG